MNLSFCCSGGNAIYLCAHSLCSVRHPNRRKNDRRQKKSLLCVRIARLPQHDVDIRCSARYSRNRRSITQLSRQDNQRESDQAAQHSPAAGRRCRRSTGRAANASRRRAAAAARRSPSASMSAEWADSLAPAQPGCSYCMNRGKRTDLQTVRLKCSSNNQTKLYYLALAVALAVVTSECTCRRELGSAELRILPVSGGGRGCGSSFVI